MFAADWQRLASDKGTIFGLDVVPEVCKSRAGRPVSRSCAVWPAASAAVQGGVCRSPLMPVSNLKMPAASSAEETSSKIPDPAFPGRFSRRRMVPLRQNEGPDAQVIEIERKLTCPVGRVERSAY